MKKQKLAKKKQSFWQKIGKKYEQPFIPNNCRLTSPLTYVCLYINLVNTLWI